MRTHKSHKYGLSKFEFLNTDPTGGLALATASATITTDYSIRLWDLVHNRFCRVFRSHESAITSLTSHTTKGVALSTSSDGNTCLWDSREEKPVWQSTTDAKSISTFSKQYDSGNFAVSYSSKKSISLFDFRSTQKPLKEFPRLACTVDEFTFTPNGQKLLIGSHQLGTVTTVDIPLGKTESVYFVRPTKSKFNLSVSPCSQFALASTPANIIDIWYIHSRVKLKSLSGHGGPPIAAFSPCHSLIASASMPVALWVPLPAEDDEY